jgi:hypothetical protein
MSASCSDVKEEEEEEEEEVEVEMQQVVSDDLLIAADKILAQRLLVGNKSPPHWHCENDTVNHQY